MDVDPQQWARWERGEVLPNFRRWPTIAKAMNCTRQEVVAALERMHQNGGK